MPVRVYMGHIEAHCVVLTDLIYEKVFTQIVVVVFVAITKSFAHLIFTFSFSFSLAFFSMRGFFSHIQFTIFLKHKRRGHMVRLHVLINFLILVVFLIFIFPFFFGISFFVFFFQLF